MAASNNSGGSHKANFARIGYASQHIMSSILQELLASYEHPGSIGSKINKCRNLRKILKVGDWRKINDAVNNGYIDFDIPLIYTIMRNLYDPKIRPSKDWNHPTDPETHEELLGDDLERCRRRRNYILHRGNAFVSDKDLDAIFNEFESIAGRLEKKLNKQSNEFVSELKKIRTCCMDEDTEKMYLDNLRDLMVKEKNALESIQSLEEQGTRTEERMSNVEQDLQSLIGKK